MQKFISFLKQFSLSVVLGTAIGFLLAGYTVLAVFQPPTADPPGANIVPPLNAGPAGQEKIGSLILNTSGIAANTALEIFAGYLQLDVTSGLPPAADCDVGAEEGRMKFDPTSDLLYICSGVSGWVTK